MRSKYLRDTGLIDVSVAASASVDWTSRLDAGGADQASRTPLLSRTEEICTFCPTGEMMRKPCAPEPSMPDAWIIPAPPCGHAAQSMPFARTARMIASTAGRSFSATKDIRHLVREAAAEMGFIQRVPVLDADGKPTGRLGFQAFSSGVWHLNT